MTITSKARAAVLLLAVLLLGGLLGATTVRMLEGDAGTHPRRTMRPGHEGYMEWLTAELDLTPEQRAEVNAIVSEHRERMAELWRELRPRFETVKRDFRREVGAVLNEDQRARFEELLESRSKHRRSDEKKTGDR